MKGVNPTLPKIFIRHPTLTFKIDKDRVTIPNPPLHWGENTVSIKRVMKICVVVLWFEKNSQHFLLLLKFLEDAIHSHLYNYKVEIFLVKKNFTWSKSSTPLQRNRGFHQERLENFTENIVCWDHEMRRFFFYCNIFCWYVRFLENVINSHLHN